MSNETEQFDWYKVLDKAIENEPNKNVHRKIASLAGGWVTCACGQLCSKLPRFGNGQPEDAKLLSLGCFFHSLIKDRNWLIARSVLDQIEARTAHLLSITAL